MITSVISSFILSYIYSEEYLYCLSKPLISVSGDNNIRGLIFTHMTEAFFTTIVTSLCISLIVTLPFIFYNLWLFMIPGLVPEERSRFRNKILLFLIIFFFAVVTCYFEFIPYMCSFFLGFEVANADVPFFNVRLEAKIYDYVLLVLRVMVTAGLLSLLPITILVLFEHGLVCGKKLSSYRSLAFVLSFLFGGFLSPPDIISQLYMALILIILYEIAIFSLLVAKLSA